MLDKNIIIKNNMLEETQTAYFNNQQFKCAVGRSKIGHFHVEGDGVTPVGKFKIKSLLYRSDRNIIINSTIPSYKIEQDDIWCDDPTNILYNRPLKSPFLASHEKLWRDDSRYDIILTLSHNSAPVIPYLGSAIFIHIMEAKYKPTAGCIAFSKDDLLEIVKNLQHDSLIIIE